MSATEASAAELSVARVRALHEDRVRAELAAADALVPGSDGVSSRGALLAQVVVVKGLAGPAEASGKPALSGPDGEAAVKALTALGHDPESVFFTLSRPVSNGDDERFAARVRLQLESVDPELVVAVDAEAARDVAAALGMQPFAFGEMVRIDGRRVIACDGLEASLSDPKRKQRVWAQLKCAVPPGPVY